jgi:hypothetical protein
MRMTPAPRPKRSVLAVALLAACSGDIEPSDTNMGNVISTGGSTPMAGAGGIGGFAAGGVGGAPTAGVSGGAAGMAGVGGSNGLPQGGANGAPALTGDDFVSDVSIAIHPDVTTILVVTWTQLQLADEVWLEFGFENDTSMTSRAQPGAMGAHRDVVLGVPGSTMVSVRIVSKLGGAEHKSSDHQATTEALPTRMPVPELLAYDAAIASPDRFMFGAVEDSDGGCNNQSCYYHTTFWLYIMDRQGRIVWYYADPASNATSSFQRIARDGEYIWIEKRAFSGRGQQSVLKMTLDHEYEEEIEVDGLADCIDVTDDGSLLYDTTGSHELREMTRDGAVRMIWSCPDHFGSSFECYSNTINWNPIGDTILLSFPYPATVIEIDRQTGDVVGQYGEAQGGYDFSPPSWRFGFQHFPNITPQGTLLVSSHMPGYEDTNDPVAGQHAFMEFEIDRQNQTLVEKWIYNEGDEWPMYKGMAIRLPNGNTLANYGTGGAIREITPDKRTAFHVRFDADGGNDFFNKMVGHNVLIDDLYALNGGGPK